MKTFINTNDYDCYYFILKDIMLKKKNESFKMAILHELEKAHPSFDSSSTYFYTFAIKEHKISIVVFVIDAKILLQYEQKSKKLYIREGRVYRISSNFINSKGLFSFVALSLLFLLIIGAYTITNKSTKVELPKAENSVERVVVEEKYNFDAFCSILLEVKKNHDCSISNLVIEVLPNSPNVAVSFTMHAIYPEQLFTYFEHENNSPISTDTVLYIHNTPSFTVQGIFTADCEIAQENNSVLTVRTVLNSSGSQLKNENYETKEIYAELTNTAMITFLNTLRTNTPTIPIRKISFLNQDTVRTNLYVQLGREGVLLLEQESFLQILEQFFYEKPSPQESKPKLQPKPVASTERGDVLGKIVLEDGTIKTFYKDRDGKLFNEVK